MRIHFPCQPRGYLHPIALSLLLFALANCAPAVSTERAQTAPLPALIPQNIPSPEIAEKSPDRSIVPPQSEDATREKKIPVYSSFDFLSGYLGNRTHPIIVEGKPWINASTNVAQSNNELGGTTFWDFWGDAEQWETPNHQWQDDQGAWHQYRSELIKTNDGREMSAYVLVDRNGPGVMDLLYFTHDTVLWSGDVIQHLKILGTKGIEERAEWGNLSNLGNLRIQVDDKTVYDGAIEDWFSGKAQRLAPDLAKIFVWRYQQFGSTGHIIPIPYQKHLHVSVYGGKEKPKWFMATGITLPPDTRVESYRGALPLDDLTRFARNVLEPENYISQFKNTTYQFRVDRNTPAVIRLNGAGTAQAIQFRLPKEFDAKQLWLRVGYGEEIGIDLPFLAFFSEPDSLSLHHSSPIGVIESGNGYLFYSNFPMPHQNGMTIQISSQSTNPVSLSARLAASEEAFNTQFRVAFKPIEKLRAFTPDYQVRLEGNGKLVGLVLVTQDQDYAGAQNRFLPGAKTEDPSTHIWPMGYLEANLNLVDGAGNSRLFSGQEDWVGGGYYFNLGYTTPGGGSNRPFGGILRFQDGEKGFATLFRYYNDLSAFRFKNGLTLSFGHGTWKNNYPVSYGATAFYYRELNGTSVELPASKYVTSPATDGE